MSRRGRAGSYVRRPARSPEENAILTILGLHADELPGIADAFAQHLWKVANPLHRKRGRIPLLRVLIGIEDAADKSFGKTTKELSEFIVACVKKVRDGAVPSLEAKAAAKRAETQLEAADRARIDPSPEVKDAGKRAEKRALAAVRTTPAPPHPDAHPACAPPSSCSLLAFLAHAATYETIVAHWPGFRTRCTMLLLKLEQEDQLQKDGALYCATESGRRLAESGLLPAVPTLLLLPAATGPP